MHACPAAQACGENLLRVVPAFCTRLAGDATASEPQAGEKSPSVYMDFLAHGMVRDSGKM